MAADLLGVGSAPGRGPEAAETARQRALAAVLQQLSAQVTSETTSHDSETLEQTRRDGSDRETAVARTDRQRTITVTSAALLRGAQFELASGTQQGAAVTWALARIPRDELVRELTVEVRDALDTARRQLQQAETGIALAPNGVTRPDRPRTGDATPPEPGPGLASHDVPRGAVAALAADEALQLARARLPLVAAAAGHSTGAQRELVSELAMLSDQARARSADVADRLDLDLADQPPRLRLSGQLDALVLRARWDGAPLPDLPVAARLGEGDVALAFTDATGLATLHVPQSAGTQGPLRAGIAVDGRLGPLVTTLPISAPAAASTRVAVLTRQQRDDGPGTAPSPRRQPSALQAPLEEALGALHFLVLPSQQAALAGELGPADALAPDVLSAEARARLAGRADYVLVVTSTSTFRSREGRQQEGILWYGTALQARFVDVNSGEAFSVASRVAQGSFTLRLSRNRT